MIARVLLKRGVVVPPHPHHNEQFSYILQGVVKFHLKTETENKKPPSA